MSEFRVDPKYMDNAARSLDSIPGRIENLRSRIENVLSDLGVRTAYTDAIRRSLSAISTSSTSQEAKVRELSACLARVSALYVQTEGRLTGGEAGRTGRDLRDIGRAISEIRGQLGMDPAAMYSDDPVNMSNGNYVYEKTFFEYDTVLPMELRMFYNVGGTTGGAMGRGWMHTFEKHLLAGGEMARVISEDGSAQVFVKSGERFEAAAGTAGTLERTADGYRFTDEEHDAYCFAEDGKLLREENPDGWRIDLHYEDGTLKRVSCTDGVELVFTYDGEGRLTGVADSAGRTLGLRYTGNLLTQVQDPNGAVTAYAYDGSGRLEQITAPTGDLSVRNTYDEEGRTLQQTFADGGTVSYRYEDGEQRIVMRRQDGTEVTYYHDDLYRNTRTVYPTGEERIEYNEDHKRTSFTDKMGRVSRYAYDAAGLLSVFTNPAGDRMTFSYTSSGQLREIAVNGDSLGTSEYDERGHQIRHTDGNGAAVNFTYDALGRVTEVEHEDGSATQLVYDNAGNVVRVTDPVTGVTEYAYDAARRVVRSTDALGNSTCYEYDALDQLTCVTDAAGNSRRYAYDSRGNLIRVTDYDGGVYTMQYNAMNRPEAFTDPDGNTTSFAYDLLSRPVRKTAADGGVTEYTYDADGRMTSIRHPGGGEETAAYDAAGNLIRRTAEDGGVYALDYDVLDRVIAVTDPVGGTRRAEYDALGNVTAILYEDGTEEHFTYDRMGNRLTHTDASGYTTFFKYNALGLLTEMSDAEGVLASYAYGPGGQLHREAHMDGASLTYTYDAAGNVTEVEDSVRGTWHFAYDALQRVICVQHTGGETETYEYDAAGRILAVTDGEGNRTAYEYSTAGALQKVTDPLGNETAYRYDPCYRLKEILQPESGHFDAAALNAFNQERVRRTTCEWDTDGNMTAMTDSASGRTEYGYDRCGRITSRKDPDGYSLRCTYRPDGMEDLLTFSDGRSVRYSYDALRRLSQIEDWLGITRIARDACGRITEVTEHDGAHVSYEWNARGACTRRTYPDGRAAEFAYDGSGRLLRSCFGDLRTDYEYYDNGQILRQACGDGTATDYRYDAAGRIASLTHTRGGRTAAEFTYAYDACGRKNMLLEQIGDAPETEYRYGYDARGSLLSVTKDGVRTHAFAYDVFGNRARMTVQGQKTEYGYDALNRLQWARTAGEERTYAYDRRGNRTGESVNGVERLQLHFDALNRLTSARSEAGEAQYTYNGLGALSQVRQTLRGGAQADLRFLFDVTQEPNTLLATASGAGWTDHLTEGMQRTELSPETRVRFFTDELGSPRMPAEGVDGNAAGLLSYEAFGAAAGISGLGGLSGLSGLSGLFAGGSGTGMPAAFTGHRADPVTGFYDAGWRQYDPVSGCFLSQDPVRGDLMTPMSLNPYLYCLNDPVNAVDPTGMIAAWLAGGIVGAVVNVGTKFAGDVVRSVKKGKWSGSSWQEYAGTAVGGFVQGSVFTVAGPTAAGAAGAAAESLVTGGLSMATGRKGYRKEDGYTVGKLLGETALSTAKGAVDGFVWGSAAKFLKIPKITAGKGSMMSVWKQVMTKAERGIIANVTGKTLLKGLLAYGVVRTADKIISKGIDEIKEGIKERIRDLFTAKHSMPGGGGMKAMAATSLCGITGGDRRATCATT